MADDLTTSGAYRDTMARLEAAKYLTENGGEYWKARDIHHLLGYAVWDKFEPVVARAVDALRANKVEPSHHIAQTSKMMGLGRGAQREGVDYFLSRVACSLIAMNGDPSKPEIAACQAYFVVQTRRMELTDQSNGDEKRLEMREKVSKSFKLVSGVAKDAGVRNTMQGVFHDARYQGLYGMSGQEVKKQKGIPESDQLFNHASALELSANDFQMNLAAEVITRENVRGERRVIETNKDVGKRVRKAMLDSGATPPESLPLAEPIKQVKARLAKQKRLPPSGSST